MKIKLNFFKKMFLYSMGIVLTTLLIGYVLSFLFLDSYYIYRKEEAMLEIAKVVAKNRNDPDFLEEYAESLKERDAIVMALLDSQGHEINYNGNVRKGMMRSRIFFSNKELKNKTFIVKELPQTPGRFLIYNEKLKGGIWISLRASLTGVDTYQKELYLFNVMASLVTLILAAVFGRMFSRKITSDVEKLNRSAHKIADLEFVEDIGIKRDDEIGELSNSIETMSKKLKISMDNMKAFVSNASHELKTPVAIINVHAQGLLKNSVHTEEGKREYYETILKTSNDMNELITNLLTISKINALDYHVQKEKLDMKSMIKNSLEKYDFLEMENDIQVEIKIDKTELLGDSRLIKLAVDNIIMNALKYSPYEGKLQIWREGDRFFFKNEKSVNTEINLEKIWDPFYRGEGKKESEIEGTGLGLSIVKKSIELNELKCGVETDEHSFCIWFGN